VSRRTVWRFVAAMAGIVVVAGLGASWWLGSELVRPAPRRVPLPADFPAQIRTIPGEGRAIAAWWVDGGERAPAVVLAHSIRADRSSMVSRARLLRRHGFSVLLIDLQAHGETPGEAITLGRREAADVRAALTWLRREHPRRRVGVIGSSLGGAAVVLGAQPAGFDAVVLEAVYPRVGRAIENRIRLRLGPLAPVLTPLLLAQIPIRLHIGVRDLEPVRSIGRLGAPVLIVAGSEDRHTTLEESRELFQAAAQPKELWVVRGANHQDFLSFDPSGYESAVVAFLKRHL
jgi:alpha-beta hydrolase superfamily lysophospholipase